MNNIPKEDDGTLAFLNIPRDENSRSFNCDETTQSKLVNTTFWWLISLKKYRQGSAKVKGQRVRRLSKSR